MVSKSANWLDVW